MALSLKESNGIQALARAVQDFLPGGGAKQWTGHVNFGTVAQRIGVGDFWSPAGSKVPRLIQLFELTLERRRSSFEPLVLAIVKEGLRYRAGKNRVTADEIRIVNGHIAEIGFKFPELWDQAFLDALAMDDPSRARKNVERVERERDDQVTSRAEHRKALSTLMSELEMLFVEPDRQQAGLALESLLNRLFTLFALAPREPFRVTGEQIDGSFELDHEVYLLEAKWEKAALPERDLLIFKGKVEGKSAFTRGVFIAMNGITEEAATAIRVGKQPIFFVVTGHDLMAILQGAMPFDVFLRCRYRLLAEEAAVVAPFSRVER